ncbi:hypothetical protein AVEN_31844-1 [Araneus ventricosus]|uniref:Uncharacterized protein n=1 Tax=Araneus ventricosus TaxID=182803 RepID=A0A4Y2L5Q7_ARAVE|nr:hypothetical protein AVEN_31844-1 [Araneus ventricosus]
MFGRRDDGTSVIFWEDRQTTNCEKLLIINFESTDLDEININKTDLSEDPQYILDIVKANQTGQCALDLAVRDPGPLNHSRWLTCANRVLRLFISQTRSSSD